MSTRGGAVSQARLYLSARVCSSHFNDWVSMHHPAPSSNQLKFLPDMFSFSGPTNLPEFDFGLPCMSDHQQRTSNNWEIRSLRKHRKRVDDEGCSPKKRRLMSAAEVDILEDSHTCPDWITANGCPAPSSQQVALAPSQSCSSPQNFSVPQPSFPLSQPEANCCMEMEAAQRKLQEIEDRITLEDDDEDEDLDIEPAQRRPVLVLSDSLKEGLQRGISDIIPHTVAQSVSHSGMELVLWRPPEDPFCRRLKDSLQKQRKQQTVCRQPATPCPSPTPSTPLSPSGPLVADTLAPLYNIPVVHNSGEEDMEM